ncbi:MAG: lytic transglycosylase domain-containing protein [Proteobacteria bacterium]|nr:lytic transglycosylase domain-containing protein [Pseudomonadota bacterium]
MRRLPILVTAMLVAAGAVAVADVYSWTDAEGTQHFTNMKPTSGHGEKWKKVLDTAPPRGNKAAAQRGGCERCDKVPATDNSPERFHRYDQFILEASALYKIPVPLIRAVIKSESDYDPRVVFDPRTNIMTGTRLLRWLANRLDGDVVLTIAGYHAGLGSLAKYGYTVPPYKYTQQYLKTVLDRYYQYKNEAARAH